MPQRDEAGILLERFRRFLRDQRQPVTRARELVAEAVLRSEDRPSVDGIRRRLREQGARVGQATVYRTLGLLVESGLVRAHDFGEGFRRYEPAGAGESQAFLVCRRCGNVTAFSAERLDRMLTIIADEHGFRAGRHRVQVDGLCRACQGREVGLR